LGTHPQSRLVPVAKPRLLIDHCDYSRLLNGLVGVIKSMIAELTGDTDVAHGFPWPGHSVIS
jgi:hypothetical protein